MGQASATRRLSNTPSNKVMCRLSTGVNRNRSAPGTAIIADRAATTTAPPAVSRSRWHTTVFPGSGRNRSASYRCPNRFGGALRMLAA